MSELLQHVDQSPQEAIRLSRQRLIDQIKNVGLGAFGLGAAATLGIADLLTGGDKILTTRNGIDLVVIFASVKAVEKLVEHGIHETRKEVEVYSIWRQQEKQILQQETSIQNSNS